MSFISYLNEALRQHDLKVGDTVKLIPTSLQKHSRSVPAHAGYTTTQFSWRDTLNKHLDDIGMIERIFPNSMHVNVKFKNGDLIGIDADYLQKIKDVSPIDISNQYVLSTDDEEYLSNLK